MHALTIRSWQESDSSRFVGRLSGHFLMNWTMKTNSELNLGLTNVEPMENHQRYDILGGERRHKLITNAIIEHQLRVGGRNKHGFEINLSMSTVFNGNTCGEDGQPKCNPSDFSAFPGSWQ